MLKRPTRQLIILPVALCCAALTASLMLPAASQATSIPTATRSSYAAYPDVPDDAWYADQFHELRRDIYRMFNDTLCDEGFCPNKPIKRKDMAVWLVRILDVTQPAPATTTRFRDVPTNTEHEQVYAGFISRFFELGVTVGCGYNMFCPEKSVTRAQMAVFFTRAFDLEDGAAHGFDDVPDGAWYSNELSALKAAGITTGCGDGTGFCPEKPVTRAQMAVFLHRALEAELPIFDELSPLEWSELLSNAYIATATLSQRLTLNPEYATAKEYSRLEEALRADFGAVTWLIGDNPATGSWPQISARASNKNAESFEVHVQILDVRSSNNSAPTNTSPPSLGWWGNKMGVRMAVRLMTQHSSGAWACVLLLSLDRDTRVSGMGIDGSMFVDHGSTPTTTVPKNIYSGFAGEERIKSWMSGYWSDAGKTADTSDAALASRCSPVISNGTTTVSLLPSSEHVWHIGNPGSGGWLAGSGTLAPFNDLKPGEIWATLRSV